MNSKNQGVEGAALRVAFIGTGNMAGAIIKGLSQTKQKQIELGLYDLDAAKTEALAEATGSLVADSLEAAVLFGDLLVLAVKPQNMPLLLQEISPFVQENQLVISVAAGVELQTYEAYLPQAKLVRAMPNTSAAVLASITGLMAGQRVTKEDQGRVELIFNSIGQTLWLQEKDIHGLIAISSSGPAYYYYFTEELARVGVSMGLSPEVAQKLARQTAIGAGKMLAEKPESPTELRLQVTSANGTTAKAIEAFQADLPAVVEKAMTACARRSKEMSGS